jgi:hypothetical protein
VDATLHGQMGKYNGTFLSAFDLLSLVDLREEEKMLQELNLM